MKGLDVKYLRVSDLLLMAYELQLPAADIENTLMQLIHFANISMCCRVLAKAGLHDSAYNVVKKLSRE